MSSPFVSVIVLNYNGKKYLPTCLDSLRVQTHPRECFEVIVSDNASSDGSLEFLRENYPWVRVLDNGCNLGFASGNNVAMQAARGQYIVLLNNDTAAIPTWLENLVAVAESDPHAGLVTSRIQLFYDQLELTLESETCVSQNDPRERGIQIFGIESGAPGGVVQYLDGLWGWQVQSSGRRYQWTTGKALVGVPVPQGDGECSLQLKVAAPCTHGKPAKVKVSAAGSPVAEFVVSGDEPTQVNVTMPAASRTMAKPLVQNAGTLFFRTGAARDRGTYVRDFQGFYEVDQGQYSRVEEVFAGCGAGLLVRKTLMDDVGMFDGDFFMYYEDIDLAWRARLRDWKVVYAPQAIVRHIHCGTSVEWSPFFIYHTDRNRLAMVFKNGSRRQIAETWIRYVAKVLCNTLTAIVLYFRKRESWQFHYAKWLPAQYRALGTLACWLPVLWRKRRMIQRTRRVSHAAIAKWFID